MVSFSNGLIIGLQVYFLFMNFTVERSYCLSPFTDADNRFLVPETVAFCKENNPLFLARPDWLVMATCVSAFIFPLGYLSVLLVALKDWWSKPAVIALVLLFVGIKSYAIGFYHLMEFTSSMPPPHKQLLDLLPYFSAEGPYLLSLALCTIKVLGVLNAPEKGKRA
jgi:hypothetical protein